MVNPSFGARWFGIGIGYPQVTIHFITRSLESKPPTQITNHILSISWDYNLPPKKRGSSMKSQWNDIGLPIINFLRIILGRWATKPPLWLASSDIPKARISSIPILQICSKQPASSILHINDSLEITRYIIRFTSNLVLQWYVLCSINTYHHLVIQSDLFGMVKWPFQRLSDLQLGDQKVTAWITWQVKLV